MEVLKHVLFVTILPCAVKSNPVPPPLPPENASPPNLQDQATRTFPPRPFRVEGCDNIAMYCFKTSTTGHVCGRTVENNNEFLKYWDFKNYCELEFMNCNEGFEVWQVAHMGKCMTKKDYHYVDVMEYYEYWDDMFLDSNYAIRD